MRARTNALLLMFFTLFLLAFMEGTALAELVFPDIADGGGYRTALLLVNGGDTDALSMVSFFSDSGAPLSVTIGNETATTFEVPIQAKGSVKLTASGSPTRVRVGWALVSAPRPAVLSGNAVFWEGEPIIQDYVADFERLWQSP